MVPNAHLYSATGEEFHPPMFITLGMHGFQVKRDRDIL